MWAGEPTQRAGSLASKVHKQTLNCININVVLMGTRISSLLPDRGDDHRTPEVNTSTTVSCTFSHMNTLSWEIRIGLRPMGLSCHEYIKTHDYEYHYRSQVCVYSET